MKKSLAYALGLSIIGGIILVACNQKKKPIMTTKEHSDAEIQTIENMKSAYKGELTATAKYAAFAKKAIADGYPTIAVLYRAVSAAESIHAKNHRAVLEDAGATLPTIIPEFKVKSTKENLFDDINGEAYEAKTMYPDFLATASKADNQLAVLSLTYAMNTEKKHKAFFEQALGDINSNTLNSLPSSYSVCPVCGNTFSNPPKHCDFSFTSKDLFVVFK